MKRIAKWAALAGSLFISCALLYVLSGQLIMHIAHTGLAFGLVIALFAVLAALQSAIVAKIFKRA